MMERKTSTIRYIVTGEAIIKDVGELTFAEPVRFTYRVTDRYTLMLDYDPLGIHIVGRTWRDMFMRLEEKMNVLLEENRMDSYFTGEEAQFRGRAQAMIRHRKEE